MQKIKTTAIAFCTAVLMLSLVSCSKTGSETQTQQTTTTAVNESPAPGKVEIKSYEFPEFLTEIKLPDMLSLELYKSFNAEEYTTMVEEQPFEEYTCESCIGQMLYTFRDGKYVGLLDVSGEVILDADTYTQIKAGTRGMLVLSRDKEQNSPDDYALFDESGKNIKIIEHTFSADELEIEEIIIPSENNSDEDKVCYSMKTPDGALITDAFGVSQWDNIEKVNIADVDTTKVYSAYYKVYKDNSYYFVCFDNYYNYTVYGGAYAVVELKVGEEYGECYILSFDDYKELNQLIESFGSVKAAKTPSKDDTLDYIQITLGINSADTTAITISSDGFCLRDSVTHNEQPANTYFSCLDKESFVSLVQWVEQVLSKEYVRQ